MDDIKLSAKIEKGLETLLKTVREYSHDIGMEFGMEKCVMLVMKSGKRHVTEGIDLPNQENIRKHQNAWRKGNLQIFGNTIKQVEMKKKLRKSILGQPKSYPRQNYIARTL